MHSSLVGMRRLTNVDEENGQVFSCGYGGLGLGETTIENLEPSQVHIDEKVVKIFATQDMAAALTGKEVFHIFNLGNRMSNANAILFCTADSGQLYSWGLGGHTGRLGLGHLEHGFVPQKVLFDGASHKVLDLALGTSHALCLCTP